MRRVVKALVWAWIIQNSVCSVSLPEITDRKFIDQCVREHNAARSSVSPAASNMLYMTWDAGLASTAKAWARQCLFEHNPRLQEDSRRNPTSSVGENIWTGYPPSYFDVTHAIKKWVNEVQDYDYNSNNCRAVCGHYTQVVWASTYKVGCAAQLCPDGVKKTNFADKEGVVFVCNYGPGGNLVGTKPYKSKGEACSGCEGGYTCMKNLCVLQITKMYVYFFLFSLSFTHSIPFFLYFYILFLIDLNKLLYINLKITVEHSFPKKYTFMYNFSLQITKNKIYRAVSDGT
uniref:SCP domain-containing protein n=1 Tax=Mola mola TaxID=94237 RepID=A0A3Q3WEB2_MOLML